MSSYIPAQQIEILETRIAPATIFVGHTVPTGGDPLNPAFNDSEYVEGPGLEGTQEDPNFPSRFFNTEAGIADPISAVVGTGGVGADTFYLKLSKGDSVLIYTDSGYVPFITGLGGLDANGKPIGITGNVIAFFVDKAHGANPPNNEVDADELTGLALGKDVSVQISGNVDGDIISNYNDVSFALGGTAESGTGNAVNLLVNPIKNLVVSGNVLGSVISGGAISGLKIVGSVEQVLAGKAANGFQYNFLSNAGGGLDGGDTLTVAPAAGVKGVSISNATIGALDLPGPGGTAIGVIAAGGGGAGAEGGAISNLTIVSDFSGFQVLAGSGGDGVAGKVGGGKGGKLTNIVVNGLDENQGDDPLANNPITIRGGNGGLAFAGSTGAGGVGGTVSGVSVGYEAVGSTLVISTNALQDTVLIAGGHGGNGKNGGAGGALTNVNVVANPTGAGNDIQILGGVGGSNVIGVKGSKAGAGGSVTGVDVQNPPQDPTTFLATKASKVIVKGGDGGATVATFGAGAAGGSVTNLHTVAFNVDIRAGNGSSGVSGGAGGSLRSLVIDEGFVTVRNEVAVIEAGRGGSGSGTRGGNGGAITTLKVNNADLTSLQINQTAGAADGGSSFKGAGGNGGSLSDFDIVDIDSVPVQGMNNEALINVRAGLGGAGGSGNGGSGGSLTGDNTIFAVNASLTLAAGAGGSAVGKGVGGKGGDVSGFGYFGSGLVAGNPGTATVTAGTGGNGAATGAGGAGGALRILSINTDGALNATAGAGGIAGATGAAGKGGEVATFVGLSRTASISLTGGDTAVGGTKVGAGGAITNISLQAATSVVVGAGDGRNGGAGGSVNGVSFTNANGEIFSPGGGAPVPGPVGPVSITGGTGSAALALAGVGGSVTNVSGVIASTGLTLIQAGGVAVVGAATKSSNGGSVADINLFGGGGAGAELRIEAGDAADVANAKKGGIGGSVSDVSVGDPFNRALIDPATIIRRIAAGDGGDVTVARGVGGLGGSVTEVRVAEDIGVRSGVAFGYNTMGGIFAGSGGTSGAGGKVALAGNVIGISADSIASIVAGKPLSGAAITARNLVQMVDSVVLNDSVSSRTNANGTFTNFATANILGGVVNPLAVGVAYPATGAPLNHPHANTFDLAVQGAAADEYGDVDGNLTFSFGDTTNANTDGFVAAVKYVNDTNSPNNVRVEALLTIDAVTGAGVFVDLNNQNGQLRA